MDVIYQSLLVCLGVVLVVLLIYKAIRKCCKCICRDPEVATGHLPYYVPSASPPTSRTAGTVITPGGVPHFVPPRGYDLRIQTPGHVQYYWPSGTATTRTTGKTGATGRSSCGLPRDEYDPEFATFGRVPHYVTSGTRLTTRTGTAVIPVHSQDSGKAVTSTSNTVTSSCLCTEVITGVVTYVGDGDGFRLFHSCPGQTTLDDTLSIRLAGIDAPEMGKKQTEGQPYSKEAKEYLLKLIRRKTLFLEKLGVDQYGRILGMAYLPNPQNSNKIALTTDNNVNLEMVKRGLACVYKGRDAEYGKYELDLLNAEAEAKMLKKGMWATDADIVTPMEYKKQQRACQPHPIFVA